MPLLLQTKSLSSGVVDARSRLHVLRDFTRDFHQAVRFQLHNVQLRGVDQLVGPELVIDRWRPIPVGFIWQPTINNIWATFRFQNQKVESSMFDRMAQFMADHIREFGSNLRTAWWHEPLPILDAMKPVKWHQGGCGLRLSAMWFEDTITIVTRVQQCRSNPTSAST